MPRGDCKRPVQRARLSVVQQAKEIRFMKKKLTILASLIAVAAFAVVLHAQPRMHGHGDMHGAGMFGALGHLARLQEKLDLSDQQVDQIKAIMAEAHEQNAPYREQLHGGMKSIVQTLINNPNDLAGAQALMDQQATAEKAMKGNLLVAASKALNVLTPEQRTKLNDLVQQFAERHHGMAR
jgi:protein CpxP